MPQHITVAGDIHAIVDDRNGRTAYDGVASRVTVTLDGPPPIDHWSVVPRDGWTQYADGSVVLAADLFTGQGGTPVEMRFVVDAHGLVGDIGWRPGRHRGLP